MNDYKDKYLKYKNKYLKAKKIFNDKSAINIKSENDYNLTTVKNNCYNGINNIFFYERFREYRFRNNQKEF